MFWQVLLAVWLGTFTLWWKLAKSRREADVRRVKSRLLEKLPAKGAKPAGRHGPLIHQEDLTTGRLVLGLMERLQLAGRARVLLEQAGLRWKVARLVHGCLALFLLGFVACWYVAGGVLRPAAVAVAAAAGSLPVWYAFRRKRARLRKFEQQFPDCLEFMARSMRAGHAFSVSIEMLCREFQEPIAGEFRRTFEEHNLGLPLEAAFEKLSSRVPSMDVRFFVSAVILQKRTGGNLAELLDKLATLMRERFQLRGKIRAVSAHGRMTGLSLSLIPIAVAGLLFLVNPPYLLFFVNDPTGKWMAGSSIALQLAGFALIKKIVSIET
jgi:tight adherence protein B